jgi:hypothetical protein
MLSMMTPDFPLWAGPFGRQFRHWRRHGANGLHQLEHLFGPWIAPWLLSPQDQGDHSRQRLWPLRLVFWTFLWQVAQAGASCREAIRQAQALCLTTGRACPPPTTSAYCQGRGVLALERLDQIHRAMVEEAEAGLGVGHLWCGRRVLVVDGTMVTAPDTPENQAAFPQQSTQRPGCGFPIIRLAALLNLATGMLVAWAIGHWHQHELTLLAALWDRLSANDVLLADCGFCNWTLLARCVQGQIDAVFRVHGSVRGDFRRGQKISPHERLVRWAKPSQRPRTVSAAAWAQLPECLTLRLGRCRLSVPGFRTRQVIVVTTLLDRQNFPPAQLGRLYFRRWAMELSLRHLKITLQMDQLSCKTPANLAREIRRHFLAHNLVRRLMLEAARHYQVCLDRISFAGSLSAARRYSEALLQARSERCRRQLRQELYRVLASDAVPERPGRREPRAVKRRAKPYPRLMGPRHHWLEIPHQSRYRKKSCP